MQTAEHYRDKALKNQKNAAEYATITRRHMDFVRSDSSESDRAMAVTWQKISDSLAFCARLALFNYIDRLAMDRK